MYDAVPVIVPFEFHETLDMVTFEDPKTQGLFGAGVVVVPVAVAIQVIVVPEFEYPDGTSIVAV